MAKSGKQYTTDNGRPSVWNQKTNDYVSPDKETSRIFEQMTGDGLVQTEDGKKNGGNDRNNNKYEGRK